MGFPLISHSLEMSLTSGMVLLAALLGNHTAGPHFPHHWKDLPIHRTGAVPTRTIPQGGNVSNGDSMELGLSSAQNGKIAEKGEYEKMALEGRTLRIVTLKDWPLSDVKTNKTTNKLYGIGVAFRFVELLRKEFGFDYTIIPTEDNSARNVVDMISEGKVDMAAAFLPIIYTKKLSYSKSLAKEEWVVLLRRPQESASGSSLLAPFDTRVWILILLSVSIVGPVIYAIMVVRVRLCRGSSRLSKVFSLTSCIWFVYGALMKQGSTLNPVSDSSRLLFATWWIFITVVTAFYTANLTAFLTLSRFTLPINGPLDIATKSFHWIGLSGSPIEEIIKENERYTLLRKSINKGLGKFLNSSDEDLMELVRQEGTMFIREKRVVERLLFKDYLKKIDDGIEESQRCTFAITPQPFLALPVGFVFPANSALPKLFNPMLTYLVEAGIVDHLMQSDLPQSEICPLDLGNKDRQLRNTDLMTTYKAVGIGLLIAVVAFTGEQILRWCLKWKNRKSKQLFNAKIKGTHYESLSFYSWFAHKWVRAMRSHKTSKFTKRKKRNKETVSRRMGIVQDCGNSSSKMNMYNGREYIKVYEDTLDGIGVTKLIPIRAPSAVLFERMHRDSQAYSKQNDWKGVMNVI